jgi:hypothetical protein
MRFPDEKGSCSINDDTVCYISLLFTFYSSQCYTFDIKCYSTCPPNTKPETNIADVQICTPLSCSGRFPDSKVF